MVCAHNIPNWSEQDSWYEHDQHDNLLWGRPAMMWLGRVACAHCQVPGADCMIPCHRPSPVTCVTCTNKPCITTYSLDSSTQSLV